jgi:hypothetical protein
MSEIYTVHFVRGGLFFLVNNVIDILDQATRQGFSFNVRWHDSLYQDPAKPGPVWSYYFEELFDLDPAATYPAYDYALYRKNHLTAPRLRDFRMEPLLLPRDRHRAHELIRTHLRLQPHVRALIDAFRDRWLGGHVVGLHLRGPGRVHGGMRQILRKLELQDGVPYQAYFRHVDDYVSAHRDARLLVCSDSAMVIRACVQRYGARVVTYDSCRSELGEMHEARGAREDVPRSRLGEDVLVEASLLANVDYLVHGNSNVSNFVLCRNPALPSTYAFADVEVNWRLVHLAGDIKRWSRRLTGRRGARRRAPASHDAG